MKRWIGLIASWAFLILGIGLLSWAVAAESINLQEASRYRNLERIDAAIADLREQRLEELRAEMNAAQGDLSKLSSDVEETETVAREKRSNQVITVSTEENKVYMRRNGELVFEAVCSTGKSDTIIQNGRRRDFRTPIGKFKIISKEEAPTWVPPDWHYIEQANKHGANIIRLQHGKTIGSADHYMTVEGSNVVEYRNGEKRVLPPGDEPWFGGSIVIPPIGTEQRKYDKVLGDYRLNLGDGYALHGTQAVSQLGQSVSHGCVRLSNADIGRLYGMANVGDEVIIY